MAKFGHSLIHCDDVLNLLDILRLTFHVVCLSYWNRKGYVTPVPSDYNDLPQLHGRATVEMLLKKPNGESFDIEGTLSKEAKMTMVIDGFAGKQTDP